MKTLKNNKVRIAVGALLLLATLAFAGISTVKQEGDYVKVYDESGNYKCSISASQCSFQGYTGSTVSIKCGDYIQIYDENCNYMRSVN
jgi:hypothetical protein